MPQGLFGKIVLVIVVSLCTTYIAIMFLSTQMMETLFIELYTQSQKQALEQIENKFDDFNERNIAISDTLRRSAALKQYFSHNISLEENDLFKIYYDIREDIEMLQMYRDLSNMKVTVFGKNGGWFNISTQQVSSVPKAIEGNSLKVVYTAIDSLNNQGETEHAIQVTKQLVEPYTSNIFGTLAMEVNEADFRALYEGFIGEDTETMILDGRGSIVSSTQVALIGETNPALLNYAKRIEDTDEGYLIVEEEKDKRIILSRYIPLFDMYLVNHVNINSALKSFREITPTLFYIGLLIMSFAIVSVFIIIRKITIPLTNLTEQMKATKDGAFVKGELSVGCYEVRELQSVYNKMIDELDVYVQRVVEVQQQKRQAELESLQMQINPHFLYNTLATIKYLAWQGDTDKLTETINALIDLLQNTIGKIDEMIPLAEEIHNLERYVIINKVRYGDAIDVKFYMDQMCEHYTVPKLILQPFVENAFFHAYQIKKEGCIRVFAEEHSDAIVFKIVDDGDGIQKKLKSEQSKERFTGIGIQNVDERIKLIYGDQYGVCIQSDVGIGTVVDIKLPKNLPKTKRIT